MHAGEHGEREQQIAAEADKGLLADRDQPGIAGEQVPQARQRHIGEDLGQAAAASCAVAPGGRQRQRDQADRDQRDADRGSTAWRARRGSSRHLRETGPAGRTARMARNTIWPASNCQPGSICAPIACDDAEDDAADERAPHAAQPADDHRLEAEDQPRRPDGRIEIGRAPPGTRRRWRPPPATSAMAMAKTWRVSSPMSCATGWSSEVARKARPSAVR